MTPKKDLTHGKDDPKKSYTPIFMDTVSVFFLSGFMSGMPRRSAP
jgi:hypothetical protein